MAFHLTILVSLNYLGEYIFLDFVFFPPLLFIKVELQSVNMRFFK